MINDDEGVCEGEKSDAKVDDDPMIVVKKLVVTLTERIDSSLSLVVCVCGCVCCVIAINDDDETVIFVAFTLVR